MVEEGGGGLKRQSEVKDLGKGGSRKWRVAGMVVECGGLLRW